MSRKSEAQRIHEENLRVAQEFFSLQFSELQDPRRAQGLRYPLPLVVISALLASVAGADDAQAMETWSAVNEEWLAAFLPMPHGAPTQDVYLAVFGALCPQNFEAVFRAWVSWLHVAKEGRQIAIDGKTSRGSRNDEGVALHSLNAWLVGRGLVLAQEGSNAKRGEIKAIPSLLKKLDLRGAVVSIDAIGCQRSIADAVVAQEGDYFLQVKGNQPHLLDDCERLFASVDNESKLRDGAPPTAKSFEEADKGHGRVEVRRAHVSEDLEWLTAPEDWPRIRSVVKIERERFNTKSEATSNVDAFYISSIEGLAPQRALELSRNHWAVENNLHWVLDVAFGEDHAQHRARNTAENLSLLRKWALNLIKIHKDPRRKGGVKNRRKTAGWDRNYLVQLITQPPPG